MQKYTDSEYTGFIFWIGLNLRPRSSETLKTYGIVTSPDTQILPLLPPPYFLVRLGSQPNPPTDYPCHHLTCSNKVPRHVWGFSCHFVPDALKCGTPFMLHHWKRTYGSRLQAPLSLALIRPCETSQIWIISLLLPHFLSQLFNATSLSLFCECLSLMTKTCNCKSW